ncbi:MAG TPA: AMP-binding protein [Candidatus Dormibacteraeota bacterium]
MLAIRSRERVVTRVLQDAVRTQAGKPAVRFEDADYTYAQLWSRARRAARQLREAGVGQGDVVLVMQENTIQFLDAWLGIALLGAVQVPVNTEYRGEMLRHQLSNSGARLMLLERQFVERIEVEGIDLLVVDESWPQGSELPESELPEVAEHDLVAIMYTSGTTGPSKGVRVTHAHAYTYAHLAAEALELAPDDVYYAPLPLFHIAGQWALVYACLQRGATAVVRRRFSAGEFWSVVRQSGATVSFLLGAMANFLARQPPRPDDVDNPLQRMLLVPLVADLEDFAQRFGVRIATCYGSTENSVPLIAPFGVSDPKVAGRPVPGFDVRIVDEHDREVPAGEVGELVVRSDEPWLLMAGYHQNPEATAKAWRNLWLHSGDAFRRDADGNFYFVDRIKDYIRRRGENISSFEVEREVNAFPAVLESAAVAVPSPHTEDDLKVVVVPKPGMTVEPEELRAFLRGRVPRFMVPDVVEVRDELPKTPTGKIQKHLLRT